MTITTLQLVLLNQELINFEFKRFEHANSLETELLPTIAMSALEEDFKEKGDDCDLIPDVVGRHIEKWIFLHLRALLLVRMRGSHESRIF